MACQNLSKEDFAVVVIDGSATPVEVEATLYDSIQIERGDRAIVWPTDGNGRPMRDAAPWKGEQTTAYVELSGRLQTIGEVGGHIDSVSWAVTHAASVTYRTILKITNPEDIEGAYVEIEWASGADLTAAHDNLKAAILAKTGLTATGTSGTGPIVATWAAGTTVDVVSNGGTGTSTATQSSAGTALATGIDWPSIVLKNGHYHQLVSTTSNDDCNSEHKTLHVEVRPRTGTGVKYRFPNAAHVIPQTGLENAAGVRYTGLRFESAICETLSAAT